MKAGLTKTAIEAFAEALAAENTLAAAARLKTLSRLFKGFASRPLRELLDTLDEVTLEQHQAAENATAARIGAAIVSLRGLELVLSKTSTRGRLDDLVALRKGLERHESAIIEHLVHAVQVLRRGRGGEQPVATNYYEQLAEQLKAALGHDERFNPLFDQLSQLDADGVASVANLLMSSGTSKSRRRDLNRIRERHESQRALLAKQRAMAGRSAA